MKRKSNTLKKQKTSMTNQKEVKGKKEEVLPSTANTLSYQALYQNGLMQVKEDYFSQSYLLGDVNRIKCERVCVCVCLCELG